MKTYDSKELDIHQPIPGLAYLSCDRVLTQRVKLHTRPPAGLFIGLMLSGTWQSRNGAVDHVFRTSRQPLLMSIEHPEDCIEQPLTCGRLALSSVFVTTEFLQRMAQDDPTGQFAALGALPRNGFCRHDIRPSQQIAQSLQALKDNPYTGALSDMYIERHATQILFDLATHIGNAPKDAAPDRTRALANQARDIIEQAPGSYQSVTQMAQQLGTNPTTLRRAFQDVFGQPIFEFVCDQRMTVARDLLRDTQLQVAQIAYRVGYRSPSNFTTAYRRRFGRSPASDRGRAQYA